MKSSDVTFQKAKINSEIIERLEAFFEITPPNEFRDHLIELYHMYILHQHDCLPHNFKQLAESMGMFLDFLKSVDDEQKALTQNV